jgi:hypothetical protein
MYKPVFFAFVLAVLSGIAGAVVTYNNGTERASFSFFSSFFALSASFLCIASSAVLSHARSNLGNCVDPRAVRDFHEPVGPQGRRIRGQLRHGPVH